MSVCVCGGGGGRTVNIAWSYDTSVIVYTGVEERILYTST